jgi:tetratricopeptide (TPR) repeat protein
MRLTPIRPAFMGSVHALARALLLVALATGGAGVARATTLAEEIALGDAAYAQLSLSAAHERYRAALASDSTSFAALWRLARVESELGEDATGEAQRRLISDAVGHARGAVKTAPDSALGHVWLAVALGRQALKEGPKTRLALSREIKSEVDRAIQIDPNIGRAWHVLAVWNRKIASLNTFERMAANTVLGGVPKGASMENALGDFQKAIELEPAYVNHHLELGRTLMDLKRWDDARQHLEKAASLPPTSNPRDPHYQQEARELLAKLPKH